MIAIKIIAGIVLGGLSGYLYQRYVGCAMGGGCPLTSNPKIMTIFGAVVGFVVSIMR